MQLRKSLEIATRRAVVRRATVLAIVVGSLLIMINHGHCIVTHQFNRHCMYSCLLTLIVPYCVSTISSVLAQTHCRHMHYRDP